MTGGAALHVRTARDQRIYGELEKVLSLRT